PAGTFFDSFFAASNTIGCVRTVPLSDGGPGVAEGGPGAGSVAGVVSVLFRCSTGRDSDATRAAIPSTIANSRSARLRCTAKDGICLHVRVRTPDAKNQALVRTGRSSYMSQSRLSAATGTPDQVTFKGGDNAAEAPRAYSQRAGGLHPHRAARRHSDHRNPGRDCAAGVPWSASEGSGRFGEVQRAQPGFAHGVVLHDG